MRAMMMTGMGLFCLSAAIVVSPAFVASATAADGPKAGEDGWISLFDGKHLTDWEASEKPFNWSVEDGCIVGRGSRSHLFYVGREFENFEYQLEVKINKGGNSGMYFRTAFGPGWPKGYEAQVNNSHTDPKRTGSLYNFVDVLESKIADDEWWTQKVTCKGNKIVIQVNGKTVVDYTDEKNSFSKGHVALQQHDPGSVVHYRKLIIKPLP